MHLANYRLLYSSLKSLNTCKSRVQVPILNVAFIRAASNSTKYPHGVIFKNLKRDGNESKPIGAFILLGIPITAFLLGCWQIKRRQWKIELIDRLEARTNAQPIELPDNLDELQNPEYEYRPFKVKGKFDHSKEALLTTRQDITGRYSSMPGGYVITPFKLSDRDLTILVNRGYIPHTKYLKVHRPDSFVQGEIELTGLLRFNEIANSFTPDNKPENNEWHNRDVDQMADYLKTAPVFIDAIEQDNIGKDDPIGGQTVINLRNEHLSYILTWFSLSVLTSILWYHRYFKYFSR